MLDHPNSLAAIERYLPLFEQDGYEGGAWVSPKKIEGGFQAGFFKFDPELMSFIESAYTLGWVLQQFNWPEYAQMSEARAFRDDPKRLSNATQHDLAKLLTIVIRQDKFSEGALSTAIKSGLVGRILRRAKDIAGRQEADRKKFGKAATEVINRNAVISTALEQGFNAFVPVYDGGIDFILCRESDGLLKRVQLKARWTIDKKYVNRDIWVAFPIKSDWYLVPHDEMVAWTESGGKTDTSSWVVSGTYNIGSPSQALMEACEPYRLRPIASVSADAIDRSEEA